MAPLRVYLDTQDYIRLFNSPNCAEQAVKSRLLEMQAAGDIAVGYSFVNIIEFITQPNEENFDERTRRGALVKEICGSNAFPYLLDLKMGHTFPNNGIWMPIDAINEFSAVKLEKNIAATARTELKKVEGLNRKDRRRLSNYKNLKRELLQGSYSFGGKREDFGGIPVSDEIIEKKIFDRYLRGQISRKKFDEILQRWMVDPEEFSKIYYQYGGKENIKDEFFGGAMGNIKKAAEQLEKLFILQKELNESSQALKKSKVESGFKRSKVKALVPKIEKSFQNSQLDLSRLESAFGIGPCGHFAFYFENVLLGKVSVKQNDVLDLMHFLHAYECDVFRCDKAMAHLFNDFEPFKGKLAPKFLELPDFIETKLTDGRA